MENNFYYKVSYCEDKWKHDNCNGVSSNWIFTTKRTI